eukprot:5612022-Amphidinium_carterae.1
MTDKRKESTLPSPQGRNRSLVSLAHVGRECNFTSGICKCIASLNGQLHRCFDPWKLHVSRIPFQIVALRAMSAMIA